MQVKVKVKVKVEMLTLQGHCPVTWSQILPVLPASLHPQGLQEGKSVRPSTHLSHLIPVRGGGGVITLVRLVDVGLV